MSERPDRVTVALTPNDVTISWLGRQVLLGRLQHAQDLRAAFEAGGATRPVELTPAQRAELLAVLEAWALETPSGYAGLPGEVLDLRNALMNDMHGAGRHAGR
jgi:hypothetical protein